MSHFTRVQTQITDLVCLKKSLDELGYTYSTEKKVVRGWQGVSKNADLVVNTRSEFDIGIRKKGKTYEIFADWWGVETKTGLTEKEFIQKLTARYAYHKVIKEVKKKGFTIAEEKKQQDQSIKLFVRKWQ